MDRCLLVDENRSWPYEGDSSLLRILNNAFSLHPCCLCSTTLRVGGVLPFTGPDRASGSCAVECGFIQHVADLTSTLRIYPARCGFIQHVADLSSTPALAR